MYDVYFSYFDGNDHLCTNVDKIEIPTSSGIRTYSGDEIASQHFRIHSEIYLYSSSTSYTISTTITSPEMLQHSNQKILYHLRSAIAIRTSVFDSCYFYTFLHIIT